MKEEMKMKKLFAFLALGFLAAGLMACGATSAYSAYVTVDINPSVGFVVNEDDMVEYAYALNADGEMLMLQLNLQNQSIETAVGMVIDEAMNLGFIDVDAEETVIEVDAVADTDKITEQVRTMVQNQFESSMSDRSLQAQVRTRTYDSAFESEAQNAGMNPAQYRLMQQAMNLDPEMTQEQARVATAETLMSRIRANAEVAEQVSVELRTQLMTEKNSIIADYEAQMEQVRSQIETATQNSQPTDELTQELTRLQTEMQAALQAMVQSYITQSEGLKTQMQTEHAARIEANRAKVEAYREAHSNQGSTTTNTNGSVTTSPTTTTNTNTSGSTENTGTASGSTTTSE